METFNDVINSGQLVLVDFFATWCQPCKTMHPILEQVKSVLESRIRIIKVDEEMTQMTGLDPATTLYFDDRAENAQAGRNFGFQSVLVKTNHLEEHQEWQDINKNIKE